MSDFEQFYKSREALLHQTAASARTLLSSLLDVDGHEYLSITARVKDLNSCLDKIKRKKYLEPHIYLTDLVGLRVIVYFEHQTAEIERLFRENLDVDEENSSDKNSNLGNDKIGYRSLHLTCKVNHERATLKEYKNISDQKFEIQIRTVLQHAWAELAHDRAYKLSGGLPTEIQREVNLYAGLLEIADKSFSKIVRDIEKYKERIDSTDIQHEEINIISLTKFVGDLSLIKLIELNHQVGIDEKVTNEARLFGFQSIGDISSVVTEEFLSQQRKTTDVDTPVGLLRNIMLWEDPEKYFTRAWRNSWGIISPSSVRMLSTRHPNFEMLLREFNIFIAENDEDEIYDDVTITEAS